MMADLVTQNATGSEVIAVTEPAGQTQDLKTARALRRIQQFIDMFADGRRAGLLERKGRFVIAIGTGGSQDQDLRFWHRRDQ